MVWAFVAFLLGQADSAIQSDEVVVFFPTYAHLDAPTQAWKLRVHGWIFEPEEDSLRRNMALGLLRRALDLERDAEDTALFKQRARAFLVDNERGKKLGIRLGDHTFSLPASNERGHFQDDITLSADDARQLLATQKARNNRLTYRAVTRAGDGRTFEGTVQLIGDRGVSVLSDIDDTIKVSEVRSKRALLANTFLKEFEPVPGMAGVYARWAEAGAVFHYVTASPWQLYEPLAAFVAESKFPAGSFHMKTFRWKDASFLSLFQSPETYKPSVIEPILQRFPKRQFLLVGDSGEKDPEIYGGLARRYPQQIVRILIRDVTEEDRAAPRYARCFADLPPERWTIFRQAAEIEAAVRALQERD